MMEQSSTRCTLYIWTLESGISRFQSPQQQNHGQRISGRHDHQKQYGMILFTICQSDRLGSFVMSTSNPLRPHCLPGCVRSASEPQQRPPSQDPSFSNFSSHLSSSKNSQSSNMLPADGCVASRVPFQAVPSGQTERERAPQTALARGSPMQGTRRSENSSHAMP